MVSSFLVICFESNAYRNIIKRVETARAVSSLCRGSLKPAVRYAMSWAATAKQMLLKLPLVPGTGGFLPAGLSRPEGKKKNPQKSLKLCEASELKEKSEGGYAYSLNDLQGKISFSKRFTGQEHIFLLLLSSVSPLSPRCLSGWGDHCPTGWESGLFGDRGGLAITRL